MNDDKLNELIESYSKNVKVPKKTLERFAPSVMKQVGKELSFRPGLWIMGLLFVATLVVLAFLYLERPSVAVDNAVVINIEEKNLVSDKLLENLDEDELLDLLIELEGPEILLDVSYTLFADEMELIETLELTLTL